MPATSAYETPPLEGLMNPPKIIFASAHRFHGKLRLGSAHLAAAMARKGWDVLFIEQPTSLFHLLHPASRQNALAKWKSALSRLASRRMKQHDRDGVEVLNLATAIPHVNAPVLRSRWTMRHWWRLCMPNPGRHVGRPACLPAAAVVFDSPFYFGFARSLGIPTVYRLADRLESFDEITEAMLEEQETIYERADLVVYTAVALKDELTGRRGSSLYLPNGVDIDAYAEPLPEPPEIAQLSRPRIIYSGTVGPWFDADVVVAAAREMPHAAFVIVGPVTAHREELASVPNIHLVGEIPFELVPQFIGNCEAAIIAFDMERMPHLVEAINPLKIYEYCAAGLPIVSYASREIEAVGAPVRTYRGSEEFIAQLRSALGEDAPACRQARMDWAANSSWDIRADQLALAIRGLDDKVGELPAKIPAS